MAEQKPGYCWNCDHEVTVHVDEAAGDVHCTSCEGSCVEVREPEQVIHHGVMCDRSGTCISLAFNKFRIHPQGAALIVRDEPNSRHTLSQAWRGALAHVTLPRADLRSVRI